MQGRELINLPERTTYESPVCPESRLVIALQGNDRLLTVRYRERLITSPPGASSLQTAGPSFPASRGQAFARPSRSMMSGTRVWATQIAPSGPHAASKL